MNYYKRGREETLGPRRFFAYGETRNNRRLDDCYRRPRVIMPNGLWNIPRRRFNSFTYSCIYRDDYYRRVISNE